MLFRSITHQLRSNKAIDSAHANINKFIKNGTELVKPMQRELRFIMWKYCGVIKNRELLEKGLEEINALKNRLNYADIRIYENSCEELASIFDLQSSLISAEASIVSALERKESRGAHQRSDYPETLSSCEYNCLISLNDEKNLLNITRSPLKKLTPKIYNLLQKEFRDDDVKDKLLE